MSISEAGGQGAKQFIELGTAFLLSAAIGLEREIRQKSAGLAPTLWSAPPLLCFC
jgi:putative Mg2+ transporter-C (MgtC) family protein